MAGGDTTDTPPPGPPAEPPSLAELFARLIDDAERFVRAEIRLYRAHLLARVTDAKLVLILIGGALVLGQAAVIALLTGAILSLAREIGPLAATAIVVALALIVAAVMARIAVARIKAMTARPDDPR